MKKIPFSFMGGKEEGAVFTELDRLVIANGDDPVFLKMDATHYIIGDTTNKLYSVEIDELYQITYLNSIDVGGPWFQITKLDDTHIVLAYAGISKQELVVVELDASWAFSKYTPLETIWNRSRNHALDTIDSTHFVWANHQNYKYVMIYTVDASYNITRTSILGHDLGSTFGCNAEVTMIDSNHFAILYNASVNSGYIKTFSFDGAYAITQLSNVFVYGYSLLKPTLLLKDATHLVALWQPFSTANGYVMTTFLINGSYVPSKIDEITLITNSYPRNLGFCSLDNDYFLSIAQDSSGNYPRMFLASVNGSYGITLELEIADERELCYMPSEAEVLGIVRIDDTHFMVFYTNTSIQGVLKTFKFDATKL